MGGCVSIGYVSLHGVCVVCALYILTLSASVCRCAQVTLIQFFAKFAKGDYTTVQGVSNIATKFGDRAQYLGISIDPVKEDAESFLKKIGTSMPEIYIDNLTVPYPVAWDQGKAVKEAFRTLSGLMVRVCVLCWRCYVRCTSYAVWMSVCTFWCITGHVR